MTNKHLILIIFVLPFISVIHAENLKSLIKTQQNHLTTAKRSQQKINKLDDETQTLLGDYRKDWQSLEDMKAYNLQLKKQIKDQQKELTRKQQALTEIEITRRRIVPFMLKMMAVLQQFIALDLPFLTTERTSRVEQLNDLMNRSDISLADKYRRLLEAYLIEIEYGYNIETYRDKIDIEKKTHQVEFLRIGRIGLYYTSVDGNKMAFWDAQQNQWQLLDKTYARAIKQALLMAKKQIPPNLITLPILAPELN